MRIDHSLEVNPERVVSIVCSSRSGSTILKYALCLHPDLCSLAGEEEPYYKLAKNGYPWHHSDELHECNNPDLVRTLIANEIHNHESRFNRSELQRLDIEEPPFVDPIECRITPTLVLKTPQNCYRRGVMEQLFPGSEIIYLRVSRDPRATINGMLDAWKSGEFTARKTPRGWWCLDMPPNWSWDTSLLSRCVNQWRQSQLFMNRDYQDAIATIRFEDFETDWKSVCRTTWQLLGLSDYTVDGATLPQLSSTDPPERERWRRKRPWLESVNL